MLICLKLSDITSQPAGRPSKPDRGPHPNQNTTCLHCGRSDVSSGGSVPVLEVSDDLT